MPGVQAYLAGLTFALAASPCSTPVLATLLGYVAASKVWNIFCYHFGTPLSVSHFWKLHEWFTLNFLDEEVWLTSFGSVRQRWTSCSNHCCSSLLMPASTTKFKLIEKYTLATNLSDGCHQNGWQKVTEGNPFACFIVLADQTPELFSFHFLIKILSFCW